MATQQNYETTSKVIQYLAKAIDCEEWQCPDIEDMEGALLPSNFILPCKPKGVEGIAEEPRDFSGIRLVKVTIKGDKTLLTVDREAPKA